jgi:hypothetical protein
MSKHVWVCMHNHTLNREGSHWWADSNIQKDHFEQWHVETDQSLLAQSSVKPLRWRQHFVQLWSLWRWMKQDMCQNKGDVFKHLLERACTSDKQNTRTCTYTHTWTNARMYTQHAHAHICIHAQTHMPHAKHAHKRIHSNAFTYSGHHQKQQYFAEVVWNISRELVAKEVVSICYFCFYLACLSSTKKKTINILSHELLTWFCKIEKTPFLITIDFLLLLALTEGDQRVAPQTEHLTRNL